MADLNRGNKIFENLVEYQLPKKTGVRDYIFYFVPKSDGYGRGARYFFDKFYPNHVRKEVGSLEEFITALHTEVTSGVQHIREIVIVAHGNAQVLLFPLLNGVTETNLKEFTYLTAFSLACLQKDLLDGKFQAFKDKRKKVITHLQNESWVTIRACNFGKSDEGMYAFYSFFGGRPNVYAPMKYLFFGSHPIVEGMRLETKLEVHEHLVKQRFLPKDIHTPERKDAIVKALIDRAQFSEPFKLASMRVTEPAPEDAAHYEGLIDDLNERKVGELIKSKFLEQDLELSRLPKVSVVTKNSAWLIKDVIKHEGTPFQIEYQIYEALDLSSPGNRQTATLWAEAKLVEAYSAQDSFPIQLFFCTSENDIWRGKLGTLAFYTEEPDADPQNRTKFDSVLALLNSSDVAISAEFKTHEIELSPQPRIKLESSTGSGAFKRMVWTVEDQDHKYLVKLEHPLSSNGFPAHTITVLSNPDKVSRLKHEYELMSYLGSDSDTPGTELPAYLDRFTIEDLVSFIDHLRSPFKPGHSVYIYHAQQALRRKKEFTKWSLEHRDTASVLPNNPYSMLSNSENEDKGSIAYEFDFDNTWSEVKASAPSTTAFQEDLFAEEGLAKKLKIPEEELANRTATAELESDSPYTDIEELRRLEKLGFERFFLTDKSTFDRPQEENTTSCEDFAAAIAKWKEVQNLEPEEIKKVLEGEKTANGSSFFDIIQTLGSHYSFLRNMGKLVEVIKLPPIPVTIYNVSKELSKLAVKKVPFLSRITLLQAGFEVLFVIEIPFKMWRKFLDEQENTHKSWEYTGKLTAIRQWLRELNTLTFEKENDFPDKLEINISTRASTPTPVSLKPYYIGRYYQEQYIEDGQYSTFIYAPDRMKKGFDEGASSMEKMGEEIMRNAEEGIGEVLQESGLESCKIDVLNDAGILDIKKLKALVIRQFARLLLEKLPKV